MNQDTQTEASCLGFGFEERLCLLRKRVDFLHHAGFVTRGGVLLEDIFLHGFIEFLYQSFGKFLSF